MLRLAFIPALLLLAACGGSSERAQQAPLAACQDRCHYDDGACMDSRASDMDGGRSCDGQLKSCMQSCKVSYGAQRAMSTAEDAKP